MIAFERNHIRPIKIAFTYKVRFKKHWSQILIKLYHKKLIHANKRMTATSCRVTISRHLSAKTKEWDSLRDIISLHLFSLDFSYTSLIFIVPLSLSLAKNHIYMMKGKTGIQPLPASGSPTAGFSLTLKCERRQQVAAYFIPTSFRQNKRTPAKVSFCFGKPAQNRYIFYFEEQIRTNAKICFIILFKNNQINTLI